MLVGASVLWLEILAFSWFSQESLPPPPFARLEVAEAMRNDQRAIRDPSDGSGQVYLLREASDMEMEAGRLGRWTVVWRAGEMGLAKEGRVFLQVSPFWGWSTPQTRSSTRPGWTMVTAPEGVDPIGETLDQQLLMVRLQGRGLRPNEELRFEYHGAADRFAEDADAFFVAVDGDGDGVRALVSKAQLRVKIRAGPLSSLHLVLPSTAEPGSIVELRVSALDAHGNLCSEAPEGLTMAWLEGLTPISEPQWQDGTAGWQVRIEQPGVYRMHASDRKGHVGASNPMIVRSKVPPILWADLQVHTALSDGTGALDEVYRYARDVAGLDAICITDHDHWGMRFLDSHPQLWKSEIVAAQSWNRPGDFVALLGFEWTNWVYGHRHVIFGGATGEILSSIDERWDTPPELWAELRKRDAISIAHHSAGGPVAVDWSIPPDPLVEPVTEIVSVHGSSEAADSPSLIYQAIPGNFVRDALSAGLQFGFLGSTDGHDGHPGLSQLAGSSGGLAALLTGDRTRAGVMEALRARRVYATNGPRIILRFHLGGVNMGGEVAAGQDSQELILRVLGTAPLRRIDLVRSGEPLESLVPDSGPTYFLQRPVPGLGVGEWLYIRVLQEDGGVAWSSPIFGPSRETSEGL